MLYKTILHVNRQGGAPALWQVNVKTREERKCVYTLCVEG